MLVPTYLYFHGCVVQGRRHTDLGDKTIRHPFQPDRLPDPGDRGVPHAAPLVPLLAPGQVGAAVVPDLQLQQVLARPGLPELQAEGAVQQGIVLRQEGLAVEADRRQLLVRPARMEEQPLAGGDLLQDEGLSVEQTGRFLRVEALDAGKRAPGGKGHEDPPVIDRISDVAGAEVPIPVEVDPALPDHPRPRIHVPGLQPRLLLQPPQQRLSPFCEHPPSSLPKN